MDGAQCIIIAGVFLRTPRRGRGCSSPPVTAVTGGDEQPRPRRGVLKKTPAMMIH